MSQRRWAPPAPDAHWLGLALLLVLGWDLAGGDLAVSAVAGGAAGFPLRDAGSWASHLHGAGRGLSALLLLALGLWLLWRAHTDAGGRRARAWTALATLATLLAVPALKRLSSSSCPWDWVDFGGSVPYVPHLWLGVVDGGPGHCFPSGHAVAAFVFLVPALAWRRRSPGAGAAAVAVTLLLGAVFGAVQVLRGAHPVSHVLWSGWLCAALAVAAERWRPAWARRPAPHRLRPSVTSAMR